MNTTEWDVVLRPGDGEPVGCLVPEDGRVVPVSLVGAPVGPAATQADATALLLARGLPEPEPAWVWRAVVVVKVSPTECRVRPEWPSPDELTGRAVLPVPVADLLRADPR